MKNQITLELDYRHTFTDDQLLHNICRSHYCLNYEEWKAIFEDILEQVAIEEVRDGEHQAYIETLGDDALSYFQRI